MKKQIRWAGAIAIAAACAVPAWGQSPAAQASPQPAPPAMPMPDAALAQLNYFAGVWNCTGTWYVDGKGHAVVSTATLAWQLNGFFLGVHYEEAKTAENPMPMVAEEHWSYSTETKRFFAGMVDGMGGFGAKTAGGWDGANFTWLGDYHAMGMKVAYRDAFVKKGNNELTDAGDIQVNGAWVKQFDLVCRRQTAK